MALIKSPLLYPAELQAPEVVPIRRVGSGASRISAPGNRTRGALPITPGDGGVDVLAESGGLVTRA